MYKNYLKYIKIIFAPYFLSFFSSRKPLSQTAANFLPIFFRFFSIFSYIFPIFFPIIYNSDFFFAIFLNSYIIPIFFAIFLNFS